MQINAYELFEMITNYRYRHMWIDGVDEFQFDEHEVTRAATEHICVINSKHFNFTTVIKDVPVDQLIYGELTTDPPPVEKVYKFYIIEPLTNTSSHLRVEMFWTTSNLWQKFLMATIAKKQIVKDLNFSIEKLKKLVEDK